MCLSHHQLVLKWNSTAYYSTNGIKTKVMGSSYGSVIVREWLLRDHNLTPSTTIKGFIIMVDCAFKGFLKKIYFGIWQNYWYVHIIATWHYFSISCQTDEECYIRLHVPFLYALIVKRHVSHLPAICFGILNKKYYLL